MTPWWLTFREAMKCKTNNICLFNLNNDYKQNNNSYYYYNNYNYNSNNTATTILRDISCFSLLTLLGQVLLGICGGPEGVLTGCFLNQLVVSEPRALWSYVQQREHMTLSAPVSRQFLKEKQNLNPLLQYLRGYWYLLE